MWARTAEARAAERTAQAPRLARLATAQLVTAAVRRGEGRLAAEGALVVETGVFTGRSPKDKYLVAHPSIADQVDWGEHNQPLDPARFRRILERARAYAASRPLFVQDLYACADPGLRLRLRVMSENAWHALFARNMFLRPARAELEDFAPDWLVLHLPNFRVDPKRDGTRSETLIALDFAERILLVVNTSYAGEIKKGIFTVLNYLLPERGVLPMHCAANVDAQGRVALFFGLSGTGKTTLSADPERRLIGDDEHGWNDLGVFNFEGGCYAKVIHLDPEAEPVIYRASNRFGAILENVVLDPLTGRPDFDDARLTENTRSSYPLHFVPNREESGRAGHPRDIVMLTCDAFGVLPPISRLTPEQATYHFLCGYTARVAGTERGLKEPKAAFSACFGAPFMPRPAAVYTRMLRERILRHGSRCWLVNTGWHGGGYGVGRRYPLEVTRRLLQAALSGELDDVPTRRHPIFGLEMPRHCPGVDERLLDPAASWSDAEAYAAQANRVAALFAEHFARFEGTVAPEIRACAIRPGS